MDALLLPTALHFLSGRLPPRRALGAGGKHLQSLAVTQAYAARFKALGGVAVKGDALRLHRTAGRWRVDTAEGPIDAEAAVVALGPWAPDLLVPLGELPLAVKRDAGGRAHMGCPKDALTPS
jgi:glycine/D-amino acid oxidase-like deaminating enzyme